MRVRFWGVRGAIAATRSDTQGIGGNTPCIEVRDKGNNLLILDAGIGLYWLGRSVLTGPLGRGRGKATILLSHSHWDHIQGFPFFVPGFIAGNSVDVWGGGVAHLENTLEGQMSPTYSPIASMGNMGATLTVGDLNEQPTLEVEGFTIRHATFKNGPHDVVGYRIDEGDKSLCYIAEVEHPGDALLPEVVDLAKGVDLLIHESYYLNSEFSAAPSGLAGPSGPQAAGHSCYAQATDVAVAAGAKRLLYFYFHPDHGDDQVNQAVAAERARLAQNGSSLRVEPAREGSELQV